MATHPTGLKNGLFVLIATVLILLLLVVSTFHLAGLLDDIPDREIGHSRAPTADGGH